MPRTVFGDEEQLTIELRRRFILQLASEISTKELLHFRKLV